MRKTLPIVIGLVLLIGVIWYVSTPMRDGAQTNRTNREVALACTTDMATEFHIHPNLEIYIEGVKQEIPTNIGVRPSCMTALHTHTNDGVLHVESPERRDFTLADFFAIWEKPFGASQIFDHRIDETHRIRMTVNGTEVDTYENTIFKDLDRIVIYYEAIPAE